MTFFICFVYHTYLSILIHRQKHIFHNQCPREFLFILQKFLAKGNIAQKQNSIPICITIFKMRMLNEVNVISPTNRHNVTTNNASILFVTECAMHTKPNIQCIWKGHSCVIILYLIHTAFIFVADDIQKKQKFHTGLCFNNYTKYITLQLY